MPAYRYFIPRNIKKGDTLSLTEQEHYHFAHVMRGKEGDHIEVVNGENCIAQGVITALSKRDAELNITDVTTIESRGISHMLAIGMPRLSHLEWIIEKGTELGITHFYLFPSARSELKVVSKSRLDRLQKIAISAMKQCGRLDLPEIAFFGSMSDVPKCAAPYFGDVRETAPSGLKELSENSSKEKMVFIGPESGFTQEEVLQLEKNGAKPISLSRHILRVETAAIVAATYLESSLFS